ncbi:MAG TPA: hypothetical protein VMH39_13400 [Gemmatimonadaceae bacterium]|nr:hypothetical protein [Gemmatimonadaceae bacterium]
METKRSYATRESILKLLSNEETARVSTREGARALVEGDEFIDLEHPEHGVRRVQATTKPMMDQVLPRSAVRDETWAKIVKLLGV